MCTGGIDRWEKEAVMSIKIPFDQVKATVKKGLLNLGLSEEQAEICAEVHT